MLPLPLGLQSAGQLGKGDGGLEKCEGFRETQTLRPQRPAVK